MTEHDSIQHLHAAVQSSLHHEDAHEAQGNVVTGWVVVAESMDPTGRRWLSRINGTPGGGQLTEWAAQGLLFNALNDDGWDVDEDDG
jgi:hypothetical protein